MVRSWGAAASAPAGSEASIAAMRRFLPWPFGAGSDHRGLITLAWMAALVALGYGVIDLWDGHAWNKYRSDYEAHVASLDVKTYIPKPILDSDNFATTPVVQSWFKQHGKSLFDDDAYSRAANMLGSSKRARVGWKFEDLVIWQEAFAAVAFGAAKPKDGFHSEDRDLASARKRLLRS